MMNSETKVSLAWGAACFNARMAGVHISTSPMLSSRTTSTCRHAEGTGTGVMRRLPRARPDGADSGPRSAAGIHRGWPPDDAPPHTRPASARRPAPT